MARAGARAAAKQPRRPAYEYGLDGIVAREWAHWEKPDIIEWICSDKFLDRGRVLYPRQATLLKLIFLAKDLLTDYDRDVLGEWSSGFRLPDPGDHEGGDREDLRFEPTRGLAIGITPDWETRMDINIAEGRPWFREVMPVIGRRGSKGHIGGIAGSRVLAEYIFKGNPQDYFGIDRDKKIQAIVFAGKKEQAKVNQWQDLVNVIVGSPFLAQYVSRTLGESLTVFAPSDAERSREMRERGIFTEADLATFLIVPKESTLMAGRGPTSFMQFYDEMAHVVATGANRSAEEVYQAATPSLDQFGVYGFIYTGSSPWQMTGQLYENYLQSLAVDPVTRLPLRPEMLMVQLASWDLYKDWQYADTLPMVPGDHARTFTMETKNKVFEIGKKNAHNVTVHRIDRDEETGDGIAQASKRSAYAGVSFEPLKGAIQEYDEQMKRLERANPDTFKVERLSQWATALDVYLDYDQIKEMFASWHGENDIMKSKGRLSTDYVAHGDPSESGDNFGWAIAHAVGPDDDGLYHVVFDKLHAWLPSDYEDSRIDYIQVEKDIVNDGKAFIPTQITFDQFSGPGTIQRIQQSLNAAKLPRRVDVHKQAATQSLNWIMAETFKTALNMGLIHAPYHELAELELRFLQKTRVGKVDHPTSGPVQSKDVADCFDDQTEVLTEHGWKLFIDVAEGERVATRSAGGVLEFQAPTHSIARHHRGEMLTYEGERLNFSVTPSHRMLVSTYETKGRWRFEEARNLTGQRYLVPKTATPAPMPDGWVDLDADQREAVRPYIAPARGGAGASWSQDERDYLAKNYAHAPMEDLCSVLGTRSRAAIYKQARNDGLVRGQIGDRVLDLPPRLPKTSRRDFAAYVGFWLAEGAKTRSGYEVIISQTKTEGIEWVDALMGRMEWPVYRRSSGREIVWGVKSRGLREWLRRCVLEDGELTIPDEVFNLWSTNEKEALLEGLMMGDGTHGVTYYSSSKRLVDDVQRLLIHLGRQGRVRRLYEVGMDREIRGQKFQSTKVGWSIHDNASDTATLATSDMATASYDGMVYCLTVPNGTLLTRRHGIPFWAGNCMFNVVYNLIGDQMGAFLKGDLASFKLHATQAGGIPQTNESRDDDTFSQLGTGGSLGRPGDPRMMRRGGVRRPRR